MNDTIAEYPGEMKLLYSADEGMRICCSRKIISRIQPHLRNFGFECTDANIEVQGSTNIHDFIEVSVTGSNMKDLLHAVTTFLSSVGIIFSTDYHTVDDDGDEDISLNLTNYSVFDR